MLEGCNNQSHSVLSGKVVGGSMAPNFLGEHVFFECSGCQSDVISDLAQASDRKRLICPYCGVEAVQENCQRRAADSVRIEVDAPIERWDVVAFKVPGSTDSGIKRIVGVDGETIEIRDGNLWADGKLIRKSLKAQRLVRVLVHDSKHATWDAPVWLPENPDLNYKIKDGQFRFGGVNDQQREVGWIEYSHQRYYAHRPTLMTTSSSLPIEDNYGYNQDIARSLNPIEDIFVELEVESAPSGNICWQVTHRFGDFVFTLDVNKRHLMISKAGETKSNVKIDASCFSSSAIRVEFSSFDQQFLVAINGQTVYRYAFESSGIQSVPARIKVGSDGGVTINRIQIWRDLYYLAADGLPGTSQTINAGPGDYVLLGDNVPISVDSRHWEHPTISAKQIIGRISVKLN